MIHKKEGTLVLSFLCPCRVGKTRSLLKRHSPAVAYAANLPSNKIEKPMILFTQRTNTGGILAVL